MLAMEGSVTRQWVSSGRNIMSLLHVCDTPHMRIIWVGLRWLNGQHMWVCCYACSTCCQWCCKASSLFIVHWPKCNQLRLHCVWVCSNTTLFDHSRDWWLSHLRFMCHGFFACLCLLRYTWPQQSDINVFDSLRVCSHSSPHCMYYVCRLLQRRTRGNSAS